MHQCHTVCTLRMGSFRQVLKMGPSQRNKPSSSPHAWRPAAKWEHLIYKSHAYTLKPCQQEGMHFVVGVKCPLIEFLSHLATNMYLPSNRVGKWCHTQNKSTRLVFKEILLSKSPLPVWKIFSLPVPCRMALWCLWHYFMQYLWRVWARLLCWSMYMELMAEMSTWNSARRKECCWSRAGYWPTVTSGNVSLLQQQENNSVFSEESLQTVNLCILAWFKPKVPGSEMAKVSPRKMVPQLKRSYWQCSALAAGNQFKQVPSPCALCLFTL